ncbi:hypothetical protein [Nocardia sp. NPDC005998]|uniref:hypothetical protein n=1 Tax=Nocardia sp. NPDC005998 TaxID=3156894 RepID=UPI0033A4C2C7
MLSTVTSNVLLSNRRNQLRIDACPKIAPMLDFAACNTAPGAQPHGTHICTGGCLSIAHNRPGVNLVDSADQNG